MSSCLSLDTQPFPTSIIATVFDSRGPHDAREGTEGFQFSDPAEMEHAFDTFLSGVIDSTWGLTNYDRLRLEWSVRDTVRGKDPRVLVTDIFDEWDGRVVGYVEVLRLDVETNAAPVVLAEAA